MPGDREDIVLAALKNATGKGFPFCGMVLSDDLEPAETLLQEISRSPLPVIVSRLVHRKPDCQQGTSRLS